MDIHLEMWEINLILKALAELPYNRTAATIRSIEEQVNSKEAQE